LQDAIAFKIQLPGDRAAGLGQRVEQAATQEAIWITPACCASGLLQATWLNFHEANA